MLSSDWLIKGTFFSTNFYFFLLFVHRRGICPWEFHIAWYLPLEANKIFLSFQPGYICIIYYSGQFY